MDTAVLKAKSNLDELFKTDEPRPEEKIKSTGVWPFPTTLHPETLKVLPFNLDNFEDAPF